MKSIMHQKDGTCYLCMKINKNSSPYSVLQEHHVIFGYANRKLSEKYGLKVYLCINHHTEGKSAVHNNAEVALILKKDAQKCFEKQYPELSFKNTFGKNYLDDEERQQTEQEETFGFIPIDDGINDIEWE